MICDLRNTTVEGTELVSNVENDPVDVAPKLQTPIVEEVHQVIARAKGCVDSWTAVDGVIEDNQRCAIV